MAKRKLKDLNKSASLNGGKRPGAGMPQGHITRKTRARKAAEARVIAEAGLTAARVLEELRRIAFSDIRQVFTEGGALKPVYTLGDEAATALASVEVVIKNVAAGDGQQDVVHKIKFWDKVRALEALGKHFGLFVEQIELSEATAEARVARLMAARRRVGDEPEEA
jgi:hypothetical protein